VVWGATLVFLSDNKTMAARTSRGITLWNADTGKIRRLFPDQLRGAVDISPDGKTLAMNSGPVVLKEVETGKKKGLSAGIAALWQVIAVRPGLAMAFGAVLLLVGFGSGLLINREKTVIIREPVAETSAGTGTVAAAPKTEPVKSAGGDTATVLPTRQVAAVPNKQLEELTAQMHEMRELMMLSLLQNPSASERMRAVSYTSEIHHVNPKIAEALLTTLNNDPNVNVRLTTLEALTHFARDPIVREGLIESILQQESPLVQAAMADVMLKLQEKRSIQPFKKLLQQKDLNGMVRSKIEDTINRLT